jgi:hypothetical protein
MSSAISTKDRERLVKVLALLSSDQIGERAAAGFAAARLVKDRGLTWDDVLVIANDAAAPRASTFTDFQWTAPRRQPEGDRSDPSPKKRGQRPPARTPEEKAERKTERERKAAEKAAREAESAAEKARQHDAWLKRHDRKEWLYRKNIAAMDWADAAAFCLARREELTPGQIQICTGGEAKYWIFRGRLYLVAARLGWRPADPGFA